jgi:hypothetical protein
MCFSVSPSFHLAATFVKTKCVVPTQLLFDALRTVGVSELWALNYGSKMAYQHFVDAFGDCFVNDNRNEFDIAVNYLTDGCVPVFRPGHQQRGQRAERHHILAYLTAGRGSFTLRGTGDASVPMVKVSVSLCGVSVFTVKF